VSAPKHLFQSKVIIGNILRKRHQLQRLKPFHPRLRTNINEILTPEHKNHFIGNFYVNYDLVALLTLGFMPCLYRILSFDGKHARLSDKIIDQMQKC
jgi:hypothetical protein